MQKESKDIFDEAASIILKKEIQSIEVKPKNDNLPQLVDDSVKEVATWTDLTDAINSKHAKRFNAVLEQLPDREFVRVYLKSLEFFKPKIIRQAGLKGDVKDNTINIQINYGDRKEDIK